MTAPRTTDHRWVVRLPWLLAVVMLVAHGAARADDWERGPNEKKAKSCTSHKLETPYRGVGYHHIVTVENTCDHTEHCEIKASSNDQMQTLDVPAKSSRSITVRRGSPAREFTATVTCKKK